MAYLAIRDMAKLGQSQHAGVAQALDAVVVGLDQAFPGLKDVRDSIEHSNERARGKAQKEEIDPQGLPPFTGAGSLSIGNLWGDDFHWTAADGREAVVSITPESLAALSAGVQAMLDALPWEGDPEPVPSDPGEMP
jgi:hypothetical protein